LLAVALVVSAGLLFLAFEYEQHKFDDFDASQKSLEKTHRRYLDLVKDIDLLEQHSKKYADFKASGLLGGERRLSWVESLESTNSVLELPTLTYNLEPQEGFSRPALRVDRDVVVSSSPMQLRISMLHEEDLFALLDGLKQSISTLFTVDSCSLDLIGQVGKTFDTRRPNLNANCVVRWINVDVKS